MPAFVDVPTKPHYKMEGAARAIHITEHLRRVPPFDHSQLWLLPALTSMVFILQSFSSRSKAINFCRFSLFRLPEIIYSIASRKCYFDFKLSSKDTEQVRSFHLPGDSGTRYQYETSPSLYFSPNKLGKHSSFQVISSSLASKRLLLYYHNTTDPVKVSFSRPHLI